MGSLTISTAVLFGDSDAGKLALVRGERLTRLERRTLRAGFAVAVIASVGIFVEIATGGSGWPSAILALSMAVGNGGFAVLLATADAPILP